MAEQVTVLGALGVAPSAERSVRETCGARVRVGPWGVLVSGLRGLRRVDSLAGRGRGGLRRSAVVLAVLVILAGSACGAEEPAASDGATSTLPGRTGTGAEAVVEEEAAGTPAIPLADGNIWTYEGSLVEAGLELFVEERVVLREVEESDRGTVFEAESSIDLYIDGSYEDTFTDYVRYVLRADGRIETDFGPFLEGVADLGALLGHDETLVAEQVRPPAIPTLEELEEGVDLDGRIAMHVTEGDEQYTMHMDVTLAGAGPTEVVETPAGNFDAVAAELRFGISFEGLDPGHGMHDLADLLEEQNRVSVWYGPAVGVVQDSAATLLGQGATSRLVDYDVRPASLPTHIPVPDPDSPGLATALGPDGVTTYDIALVEDLKERFREGNTGCRAASLEESGTLEACEARNEAADELREYGWCYGEQAQETASWEWHLCKPLSIGY